MFNFNKLPNVDPLPQNYPVTNLSQLKNNSPYVWPTSNEATSDYFNQNLYQWRANNDLPIGQAPQEIYNVKGNLYNSNYTKEQNMRPFYGAKIPGHVYDMKVNEAILDNYVGSGSQVIKKIEQAPLFKPQQNMEWAVGAPNQTEFLLSRQIPSSINNNVKPFPTVHVGPGLGLGFTEGGAGGFNSGMLARDKWMDKTINELRVETNPKIEYTLGGHEGPVNSIVKNRGIIGIVEKNNPDRFYISNQDRLFTTTGAIQGELIHPMQDIKQVNRNDDAVFYPGPARNQDGPDMPPIPLKFDAPKKMQLEPLVPTNSHAVGRGDNSAQNRMTSYTNYNNHRSTTLQPRTYSSGFTKAIGAVIAPISDYLRPTKKEEYVNCQKYTYTTGPKSIVPSNTVFNNFNTAPTTIRETTLYSANLNINAGMNGIYVNNCKETQKNVQREGQNREYMGPVSGPATSQGLYQNNSLQNTIDKTPTLYNRPTGGNMNLFNTNIGATILKPDQDCADPYFGSATSVIKTPATVENYGALTTKLNDHLPGSAARNKEFVIEQFLKNPFTPYPHSLTYSV